jgi:hypothetical protein
MLTQGIWGRNDGVLDHLQGNPSCTYGSFAARSQDPECFHHAVPASWCNGALACKGGVRCVLGVQIIILSTPTPIMSIRRRDFQNFNLSSLKITQQASTIAAG